MSSAEKPDPPKANGASDAILMELILEKSGLCYLYHSDDMGIFRSANLPECLKPLAWQADDDALGVTEAARVRGLRQDTAIRRVPASTEIEVTSPTGVLTYQMDFEPIHSMGNSGVLSVITDISESRRRERVLKTLLRELSHRSKNLLAIIQGIATQTARQALSLDSFLSKFRGRIQSLAYSQDLVTDSSWRGAYLFALVDRQFSAYWPLTQSPISINGINAHLSPNAALHIGLALHELIVSSAAHGAIAAGANSVTIDCVHTTLGDQEAIELAWTEHVPGVFAVHRDTDEPSFARTVLERVVPIAIGGTAVYLATPNRVEYRLTIPAQNYEIIAPVEG